jgi:hypothetical protein
MQLTVKAIGPFGVNDGSMWYKFGKGMSGDQFTKGSTYDVETFKGKSGIFINKINGEAQASAPVLNPEVNKMIKESFKPAAIPAGPTKYGKPLSAYEVEQEYRIRKSGIIQASVQAVSPHVANKDQLVTAAIEVAEELLKWVDK